MRRYVLHVLGLAQILGVIACHTVLAQGTILFRNFGVGVDAPILYHWTAELLAPLPEYHVALYAGTNQYHLEPVAYTSFTSPGYFGDSTPVFLPKLNSDLPIILQVRIWNSYTGSTFEEAEANGGPIVGTPLFFLKGPLGDSTKDPPIPPPELLGLQSVVFPGYYPMGFRFCGPSIDTKGFGFNLIGCCETVTVQATTNLVNPSWVPLLTTSVSNGFVRFTDPEWTNTPWKFYRVLRLIDVRDRQP